MRPAAIATSTAGRRWLPRFGLRTLLILVAIFGVGFGYLGHLYRRVAHQRYIVAKIQEAGGEVRYNWQLGMGDYLEIGTNPDAVVTRFEEVAGGLRRMTRVTRTGTSVQTETLPGPWILRKLLGNDVFAYVESVDFERSSHPSQPIDPQLLLELPNLKTLSIVDRQISDKWLHWIARIPQLRVLNLSGNSDASATSNGLSLLELARNLEALGVSGDWLTDDTFSGIGKLHQLKQLSIAFAPQITSAIFADVGQLTNLQELSIVRAKHIDDEGTEPIRDLSNLRVLLLMDTSIGDITLDHLAELDAIESLSVIQANIGDPGGQKLANLSTLKLLALSHTNVGDVGVEAISTLPNLRKFNLAFTRVTDACVPAIARLTQLEDLSLHGCAITDQSVSQLKVLRRLERLSLGAGVTKESAEQLRQSLPRCRMSGGDGTDSYSLTPR
jgi:Leucine-rich repeat (LRR) protein